MTVRTTTRERSTPTLVAPTAAPHTADVTTIERMPELTTEPTTDIVRAAPGTRFVEAFDLVVRRGAQPAPLAHLLAVASLVLENAGDEDQACAALLHHALTPNGETEAMVRTWFGDGIADMAIECTHDTELPLAHPGHAERIEQMQWLSLLVALADHVHQVRTLAAELDGGLPVWDCFDVAPSVVLRHYRNLLDVYTDRLGDHTLVLELDQALRRIWP